MDRYVLKINNSTYVSDIHWIMFEIPYEIKTSNLQNAKLFTEEYLNYTMLNDGTNYGKGKTRYDIIQRYYPHIKAVKIKIVEDE